MDVDDIDLLADDVPVVSAAAPAASQSVDLGDLVQEVDLAGSDHGALATPDASARTPGLEIVVDEPEKRSGANKLGFSSTYMTYRITSRCSLPEMGFETSSVRRRFSDFEAMHKLLRHFQRGYFLPTVPDKTMLGVEAKRMKDEFIQIRMVDLNKLMRSIAAHPALRTARATRMFLTVQEELTNNTEWKELQAQASVLSAVTQLTLAQANGGAPAGGSSASARSVTGSLMKKFKELKTQINQEVSGGRTLGPEMSTDERMLRAKKLDLTECLAAFRTASITAETYVHALFDASKAHEALGLCFTSLAEFEQTSGAAVGHFSDAGKAAQRRAADLKLLGAAAGKLRGVYRRGGQLAASALMPVQDYLGNVAEAAHALEDREAAYISVQTCHNDVQQKRAKAPHLASRVSAAGEGGGEEAGSSGGLEGAPSGSGLGGGASLDEFAASENMLARARKEYEEIMARNNSELDRFGAERGRDLQAMVLKFARVQAQLHEALAEQWSAASAQLGPVGGAGEGGETAGRTSETA